MNRIESEQHALYSLLMDNISIFLYLKREPRLAFVSIFYIRVEWFIENLSIFLEFQCQNIVKFDRSLVWRSGIQDMFFVS